MTKLIAFVFLQARQNIPVFVSSIKHTHIPLNTTIHIFSFCQFQNDFPLQSCTQKILYDKKILSWLQLVPLNSIPLRKPTQGQQCGKQEVSHRRLLILSIQLAFLDKFLLSLRWMISHGLQILTQKWPCYCVSVRVMPATYNSQYVWLPYWTLLCQEWL